MSLGTILYITFLILSKMDVKFGGPIQVVLRCVQKNCKRLIGECVCPMLLSFQCCLYDRFIVKRFEAVFDWEKRYINAIIMAVGGTRLYVCIFVRIK